MNASSSSFFLKVRQGSLAPKDFLDLNRMVLARLVMKSYEVFSSYDFLISEELDQVVTFYVSDPKKNIEMKTVLDQLAIECSPWISVDVANQHLRPDTNMGKWAMSLIAKNKIGK